MVTYPTKEEEMQIVSQNIRPQQSELSPLLKPEDIVDAQNVVSQIYIDDKISQYIVDIVNATRKPADCGLNDLAGLIAFGGSPRASIGLALASRSYAFLKGRGYVLPEDVRAVCHDVFRQPIGWTYEAEANEMTSDEIISNILDKIIVP